MDSVEQPVSPEGDDSELPPTVPASNQAQASQGASAPLTAPVKGGIAPPLHQTLESIQDGGGVRTATGMALLRLLIANLEAERDAARAEARDLRVQLDQVRDLYYAKREHAAVLRRAIADAKVVGWLRSGALTIGGVAAGIAGGHLNGINSEYAVAAFVVSVVLILLGLPWPFGREKQESDDDV